MSLPDAANSDSIRMKLFFKTRGIVFGYCLCVIYAGALLMLESRLNYPLMNDDAYFYVQLTYDSSEQGFAAAFNKLPVRMQIPPLLNFGMLFLSRYTPLSIEQSGTLICFLAGLLASGGVFFLCRQLYSRLDLATAAALLSLSLPCWYRYAGGILRDPLFWMESVWFFGILLKYKQDGNSEKKLWLYLFLLSVLGGTMMLTRKEAPFFLFPGILWFAVPSGKFKQRWLKTSVAGFLLFALVLLISLLPKMAGIDFLPWRFLLVLLAELRS